MGSRWGKARMGAAEWHRLEFHCLDVAAVLEEALLAAPDLLKSLAELLDIEPDQVRRFLLTVMAVHDIGKVSGSFQFIRCDVATELGIKDAGLEPYDKRRAGHDLLGFVLLRYLWRTGGARLGYGGEQRGAGFSRVSAVLAAATGHHGVQPMTTAPALNQYRRWLSDDDIDAAAELAAGMAEVFCWEGPLPAQEACRQASYILNGLFTVCDWLGSNESFAYRSEPMPLGEYYETIARPTARAMIEKLGLAKMASAGIAPALPFSEFFSHLGPTVQATPLQEVCDQLFRSDRLPDGPLLVIVEDAPGAGKTEAGDLVLHRLMAAGRAGGFYCGLPTVATADSAYKRKKPVVERMFTSLPSFVLAHGRRHLNEDFRSVYTRAAVEAGEGDAQAWFVEGSKRALLAAAGVGTVDQALMGALRTKHGSVRLWGLWRKAVLVDEVHAYDDYMLGTLKSLLYHQASRGESVVLMSATLPSRIRAELLSAFGKGAGWVDVPSRTEALDRVGFPLLGLHHGGASEEHRVALRSPGRPVAVKPITSVPEATEQVMEWARAGRCAVWFRNTVDDAMEAFDQLTTRLRGEGLPDPILFHARFLPEDRAEIEKQVLGCFDKESTPAVRRSRVLVATQVAEQSLDLDADEFVSDLAPPDSILQRLGRRRRHARTAEGVTLPRGSADGRPDTAALLLMPDLSMAHYVKRVSDDKSPWYGTLFPRSTAVYPDDARLWRGAQHLTQPETIPNRIASGPALVPEVDARPLLESVYAATEALLPAVPKALHGRHGKTENTHAEEKGAADLNTLAFKDGLLKDWVEGAALADGGNEDRLPTRLGDSYTVVLAFRVDRVSHPVLAAGMDQPIELSCISLPRPLETLPADLEGVRALTAELSEGTRRRLRYFQVVVLSADGAGGWVGQALRKCQVVSVRYDTTRGLRVTR